MSAKAASGARSRRIVWRLVLVLVIGLVASELCLRWLLFGGTELGWQLRRPGHYADRWNDDLYWRLQQRFRAEPGPLPQDLYHPELGWRTYWIDPDSYQHKDGGRLAGRRPVLLYGDSFARCTTPQVDCFEGLLDRSPLRDSHMILNYGVPAYGIDQMYLLMKSSIKRWMPLSPIVVFGIFVDDDIDRAYLRYRGWPKPRLVHGAQGLTPEQLPVPLHEEFLHEHPDRTPSYLWRWLLHGSGLLPNGLRDLLTGERARHLAKTRLARDILRGLKAEMEERGLEYFVVLFHGQPYLYDVGPTDWREALLLKILREERIPFVSSKNALQRHALSTGRSLSNYYDPREGSRRDHYLPLGNAVVFQAIRGALAGRFESRSDKKPIRVESIQIRDLEVEPPLVRHLMGHSKNLPDPVDADSLLVRVREAQATTFAWSLNGRCSSFSAVVKLAPTARQAECGSMSLSIHVDDEYMFGANLSPAEPEYTLELDLRGAQNMVVNVDDGGDGVTCDLLLLSSPIFR